MVLVERLSGSRLLQWSWHGFGSQKQIWKGLRTHSTEIDKHHVSQLSSDRISDCWYPAALRSQALLISGQQ